MASMASGGGAGGAGAIKAGAAFVQLFAEDTALNRGLDRAAARVKSFGARMAGVGLAVLGPALAAVTEMIGHFGDMQDAADRLSTTPEIISSLGYAADQSGASLEDVEVAAKKLYQSLAEAGKVAGPLDEEFKKFADELAGIEDPAAKSARALDVLGKNGLKLLPMLKGGSKGLQDLLDEADEVGDKISGEDAARAERAGDAIDRVWKSIKNTIRAAAAAALPFISTIESASRSIVGAGGSARLFIRENAALIVGIAAAAAGVFALGTAITGVGFALSAAGVVIGTVTGLITFLLSPIGLITAAVVGLTAALVVASGAGETFADGWRGITNALLAGDLELAGRVAMETLNVAFLQGVAKLREGWDAFTNHFAQGWKSALSLMKTEWSKFQLSVYESALDLIATTDPDLIKKINDRNAQIDELTGTKPESILDRLKREAREKNAKDIAGFGVTAGAPESPALKKAKEDVAAAEARMRGLLGEAALKALFADIHRGDGRGGGPPAPDIGLPGFARGTFDTRGFGSQAFGDMTNRQVKAAEKVPPILERVDDKLGKILEKGGLVLGI